jgi:DNA-binding XRE family transcriptional regulator
MKHSPPRSPPFTARPGIGIAIDRHKFKQLREAALLERIDLSELSRITELRELASDNGLRGYARMDEETLTAVLEKHGVPLPRHIGISRDAIAKIENGDRKRPKISTLRILIDTLNTALAHRGEPTVSITDLYAAQDSTDPGEEGTADEGAEFP